MFKKGDIVKIKGLLKQYEVIRTYKYLSYIKTRDIEDDLICYIPTSLSDKIQLIKENEDV